eukprot:CAMPEP_0204280542 /NCGR_PEP_ID=MMETSP0468-20130131/38447_1 /ASSEMBLY_ACC=CAM_ASM_000383 /TAXON_ID=2969 /ORGANISM="Oxyrrhis marina" /LENGTH=35 /DNA_ID= /DNA_START= /DNA_END= /DNA_ORIENTATION=
MTSPGPVAAWQTREILPCLMSDPTPQHYTAFRTFE